MELPKIAGTSPIKHEAEAGKPYSWCTCGLSENQPFCNGAHKPTEMRPMRCEEAEDKSVFLCTCKKTSNPPYCDGTHKSLA